MAAGNAISLAVATGALHRIPAIMHRRKPGYHVGLSNFHHDYQLGVSAANHIPDSKKQRRKTVKKRILPSPEPYASWVEHAVATADTRGVYLDSIMGEYPVMVSRDELRQALRDEYYALCKAAGVEISEESFDRLRRHAC